MNDKNLQQQYYENTVSSYDKAHADEDKAIDMGVGCISYWALTLDCSSILDVGCGTGRAMNKLIGLHPDFKIHGVEPVEAMVQYAIEKNEILADAISIGSGDALQFSDASFDVVCEFAVLHHVKRPEVVIAEMTRVARKAVFLVDSNRFGQGGIFARYVKLGLYKLGLWKAFDYLRTGGKGYMISEGDGLFYSYSVYDSYHQLAQWADRIILIPLDQPENNRIHGMPSSWYNPLLTSSTVLLCAFRDF